jgi:hypothetical protein
MLPILCCREILGAGRKILHLIKPLLSPPPSLCRRRDVSVMKPIRTYLGYLDFLIAIKDVGAIAKVALVESHPLEIPMRDPLHKNSDQQPNNKFPGSDLTPEILVLFQADILALRRHLCTGELTVVTPFCKALGLQGPGNGGRSHVLPFA